MLAAWDWFCFSKHVAPTLVVRAPLSLRGHFPADFGPARGEREASFHYGEAVERCEGVMRHGNCTPRK